MNELHETRTDPRVSKTKRSMKTAMFQLLEKHTFDKITVNDICNVAMISRTTFYQHFQDKYELLAFGLEQEGRALVKAAGDNRPAAIHSLLCYVMEHRRIFQNIFVIGGNEELLRMLSNMTVTNLQRDMEAKAGAPGGVPAEIAAVFLSGGMASLMHWWIGSNMALSVDDLTGYLLDMFRSWETI